jgi:cob(I)alamin adenosyltransferase
MKKVHLGDSGETSLVGGRLPKDDLRIECYGTIDELNSAIGLMRSFSNIEKINSLIDKIQNDLFVVGAELSNVTGRGSSYRISEKDVKWLEKIMEELEVEIKPLNKFVLPGGSNIAAACHLARSICRRAERRIVSLSKKEKINPEIVYYINRLSDVLFVMARFTNQTMRIEEKTWGPDGLLGI